MFINKLIKFHNSQKGIQGAVFGIVDGIIAILGTTFAISALSQNPTLILASGLAVGISNGIANSAGFFLSEEVETEHGIANHTKREIFQAACFCFVASILVVFVSLSPYFFVGFSTARILSLLIGLAILFSLGAYHATISRESKIKEGLKFLLIGFIAALLCFGLGKLINQMGVSF